MSSRHLQMGQQVPLASICQTTRQQTPDDHSFKIRGILAVIQSTVFCLFFFPSYPKTLRLKYTKTVILPVFAYV
jgi:hypothetical protein